MKAMEALERTSAALMGSCILVGVLLGGIYGFNNHNMLMLVMVFIFSGILHLGADMLKKYEK